MIIHPFLLAIYPILFFYSQNAWLFLWSDPLLTAGIVLIITFILFYALGRVLKNYKKSSLIVSLSLLIFFSYGHIINFLKSVTDGSARIRYVMLALVALYILGDYLILKTKHNLTRFTKILNLTAAFLVLMPISQIGLYAYQNVAAEQKINKNSSSESANTITSKNLTRLSDIYYIILDGYAGQTTLKESFDYTNDEFYNFLSEKGFYIASQSASNYSSTMLSLASSLNMRYLEDFVKQYGQTAVTTAANAAPLRKMTKNNAVQQLLKSKGYKFIYVTSGGFTPTSVNRFADVNFSWDLTQSLFTRSDFISSLLRETSILEPLYLKKALGSSSIGAGRGVLYSFDRLKGISARPSSDPVFVFAHILSPHPEFTLDQECNIIPPDRISTEGGTAVIKPYLDKLICTNKLLEEFISQTLEGSRIPPIIILQSDHGFISGKTVFSGKMETADDVPPEIAKEALRNFNAYYLPNDGDKALYPSITPVNSFRIIFNYYFNTSFEILDDRNYFMPSEEFSYRLLDVTDNVSF